MALSSFATHSNIPSTIYLGGERTQGGRDSWPPRIVTKWCSASAASLGHTSSARPQYKEAPDRDSRGILACAVLATGIASRQENRALAVAGALESLPYRIQRTRSPPQLSDEFGSE